MMFIYFLFLSFFSWHLMCVLYPILFILISLRFLFFKLQVVKGKIEEVELPEKADILISEPMGKLLVLCFTNLPHFASLHLWVFSEHISYQCLCYFLLCTVSGVQSPSLT